MARLSLISAAILVSMFWIAPAWGQESSPVDADQSIVKATSLLADAIVAKNQIMSKSGAFHRIAIPYFEVFGEELKQKFVGRIVAELIASELALRQPFVVIERERLDQVMREHRLVDLGLVDENSAAELGHILGAQTLLSGSVSEVGNNIIVNVRQVDVSTGQALIAERIQFDRGAFIALAKDTVVLKSRVGAAFRSALIPGWGQSYNSEPLKATGLMIGGLGILGSAIGLALSGNAAKAQYNSNTKDAVGERSVANQRFQTANILFVSYGALWLYNVVDAYVNGADQTLIELPQRGEL